MKFIPEHVYHVYNQGNNKEKIFFEDFQYNYFLQLYQSYIIPHCETLCWCLMPNHFHFMVYADERCLQLNKQGGLILDPITNGIRKLLSTYTHEFNIKNNRSGSLFRPKTKAKNLTEEAEVIIDQTGKTDYLFNCFNYIHNNPKEAELVNFAEDWKWSSYRFYKGLRQNSICNIDLAKKICGLV